MDTPLSTEDNELKTENLEIDEVDKIELNEEAISVIEELNSNNNKIAEDNEYDTDIEIKDNNVSYDHSGKTAYIQKCSKEGVIPAGFFLRHINGKKLEMRHHGLGLSGIKPICSSLMTNGTITSVDLTDNWLGDQSIPFLMVMMKENCFISELILANNNLTYKCAEMLTNGLSENFQISHLDLSQNLLDDRAANHLADLIINVGKLEYLNLSKNKFNVGFLLPIGKAISQSRTLVELDLSWNHITGNGIKQFCTGLSENNTIKKLHLGWNGLGSILGMQDMAKMLKTNTCLEELDISNNRITAEGAVLLGKGLTTNNTLKILKMGQNTMQTAGCYAIMNAILKNPNTSIIHLNFENIRVNHDFVELKSQVPNTMTVLTGSRKPSRPSSSIHPMKRLKTFAKKNKLSLVKYFNHFDDAQNINLTKNDFRLSLQYFCQETNFDLTENEMERLLEDLDKTKNGYIQYKDFMELNYLDENNSQIVVAPAEVVTNN